MNPLHSRGRPLALAAALLVASTVAIAGPGPGRPGPMGGPGGPGAPGGIVEHVLADLEGKLALDGSQKQAFDRVRAQAIAARDRGLAARADVRTKVDAELAKPEPDLAAVASLMDGAEEQGRALRRQVRDEWLKLYASLRPDQKTVVRDELKARMARAEGMRDRMHERKGMRPS